jgi:two-component sensor histidine kinase
MSGTYLPYIAAEAFCIAYAGALLLRLHEETGLERETACLKKMIVAYIVMAATDICWALTRDGTIHPEHYISAAVNSASLTAVALGCYYWYRFVEIRLGSDRSRGRRAILLSQIPIAAVCALNVVSIFTDWIFYIMPDGDYREGELFWIQGTVTFAYLLIPAAHSMYRAVRANLREKRIEYLTYVGYIIVPCVLECIADRYETVPLFALSIFLVIQILFLTLYLDQRYALAKKERELAESRMAIMLSQIQPHFLYNALAVIQDMCHDKAPEAEQATVEFAEFLRGNMDSLRATEPIPFSQELRHTQNYLSLEKKRFGDRITVHYDIRADGFMLPALTLQPIVENAVRYGVMQRESGGTVRISAEETAAAYVVTVTDDGVGFDPGAPKTDGRTHIGIANVSDRLRAMCGGTLVISSTAGKGTVAVISLPKKVQ